MSAYRSSQNTGFSSNTSADGFLQVVLTPETEHHTDVSRKELIDHPRFPLLINLCHKQSPFVIPSVNTKNDPTYDGHQIIILYFRQFLHIKIRSGVTTWVLLFTIPLPFSDPLPVRRWLPYTAIDQALIYVLRDTGIHTSETRSNHGLCR